VINYALILAGGFATRLRPLTYTRPKTLFPILGKPLIDWIIERLNEVSPRRVYISVRYLADKVKAYVELNWPSLDKEFLVETKPLGDAGPLVLLRDNMGSPGRGVVFYGDVYCDVDMKDLIDKHVKNGGIATVVFYPVPKEEVSKYGIAKVDDRGKIVEFVEKPSEYTGSCLANAGLFVFEEEVLEELPNEVYKPIKISTYLLPKLLEKYDVYAYIHKGLWFDIGTPEDYLRANSVLLNMMCRNGCVYSGVDEVEVIPPVYIGRNVRVGRGSVIGPTTIVLDGTTIGEMARITESILLNNSYVGNGTVINRSLIGEGVYIGNWVRVEEYSIISDQSYLADGILIARRVRIGPYREVSSSVYREGDVLL